MRNRQTHQSGLSLLTRRLEQNKPTVHTLEEGNKRIQITIYPETQDAYGFIETIPDRKKEVGATTALYTRVYGLLEDEATLLDTEIIYTLTTQSPNMKAWALAKGAELFHWDRIEHIKDCLIATKEIQPKRCPEQI